MALEDLNPAVRVEEILDGGDIVPATRLEYFMKKAANEVPKPAGSADAGKVVTVNEDGDGYELGAIPSGLPSYTSADKGKVLTIGEGEGSVTTVIVPEQTVTFNDGMGYPTNCDPTGFVVGATGVISVNGTQYNATCAVVENALAFSSQETEIIVGYANNSVIVAGDGILEQATVSLTASVPSVEPKWEAAGGGVEFFPVITTASAHTAAITAGEMQEILLEGKVPVGIAVYNEGPVNTYIIGGVTAGKAGYNVVVVGSLNSITVNDLTDYPVLWQL